MHTVVPDWSSSFPLVASLLSDVCFFFSSRWKCCAYPDYRASTIYASNCRGVIFLWGGVLVFCTYCVAKRFDQGFEVNVFVLPHFSRMHLIRRDSFFVVWSRFNCVSSQQQEGLQNHERRIAVVVIYLLAECSRVATSTHFWPSGTYLFFPTRATTTDSVFGLITEYLL